MLTSIFDLESWSIYTLTLWGQCLISAWSVLDHIAKYKYSIIGIHLNSVEIWLRLRFLRWTSFELNTWHFTDSSSASSGASSSSDGSGSTFTQTSNNGQGTFTSNAHGPGNVAGTNNNGFVNPGLANPGFANPGFVNAGFGNPAYQNPGFVNPGFGTNGFTNNFGTHPGYYGPANYNPGNFGGFGIGTLGNYGNYGPGFSYASAPNLAPQYQPSAPFGFQAPFAPQPLLTPQEFNQQLSQYLSSLQQQYAR